MKSFLVSKFTCASCSSSYIGETYCHFKTRIEEHIKKDSKSHIFKHLHFTRTCFYSYNSISFKIVDKANSKFDLKIEEALHINLRKPELNAQQNHLSLSPFRYSFRPPSSVFFFFFLFSCGFLFHLLFSLSLTLIIMIFNCLNYTSLLLLIATHLVSYITSFSFINYFQYLYANCWHLLLS